MCGIAGIHNTTGSTIHGVDKLARALHLSMEPRGRHASGSLALYRDGKVNLNKALLPASKFVRPTIRGSVREVLLHTRFATIGRKDDVRNAHPHAAGTIAAVHNGTIYNSDELFRDLGMTRKTTVDSEVVPALIDLLGWDKIAQALSMTTGGAALGIVNTAAADELVLARTRDWPLWYLRSKRMVVWASTPEAVKKSWWHTFGRNPSAKVQEVPEMTVLRFKGTAAPTSEAIPVQSRPAVSRRAWEPWDERPVAGIATDLTWAEDLIVGSDTWDDDEAWDESKVIRDRGTFWTADGDFGVDGWDA
jgi:asparagine synthetase B (glutamine-hydrolysing)